MNEMTSASNMDDARSRASRVLEVLEKSICARANAEAANNFHQVLKHLQFLLLVCVTNILPLQFPGGLTVILISFI